MTYGTLLQERRRELHAAVVEAIERSYADRLGEQTERLAHHAVRGEVWQKAMTYLHQAGQNARVRSAYRQAATFLEQALETLKRLPDTSENAALGIDLLCHDLWDPLMTLTQYQRLLDHLQRAAVLAEKVGDHGRLAEVLARTISPFRNLGQHDRAVEAGERALALASEAGDVRLRALAGMELGQAHSSGGASARAETLFNQVLAVLDSSPAGMTGPEMDWMRRLTRERLVLVLASIGRYEEAARHGEEALRMAEDLGHPAPLAGSLYRLGWVYCGRGELDKAIDLFSRALALAREREVDIVVPLASAGLGAACTLTGRTDEAVILLEEAVGAGESTKGRDPFALVLLGQAYLSAGRLADASSCAQRALIGCREQTRRNVEAHVLQLIGDIASRQEPLALGDALQNYRQALALADELGMRPLVAHCHLGLGKLYRRTDKREQARENLAIATTMYREMGMVYWLEQAEAEISGLM